MAVDKGLSIQQLGGKVPDKDKLSKVLEAQGFLQAAKRKLEVAADARKRYDYEWMVRDMFRRGYQFSRYNPTQQTLILASRQTAKIPVNILSAQLRAIRTQVTAFRPKWEVLPRYMTEESKTQARYTGRLLDYLFDRLKLKQRIKETVTQGLTFSVGGPWQIYYDPIVDEVKVWLIDPFDFYMDPLGEELEDCQYVVKAVRRPLWEVLSNPEYNPVAKREIGGGENRLAVSEYKQFMIQALKMMSQQTKDTTESVILHEGDFKIWDEESGKVKIRKMIWTQANSTPLLDETRDDDQYDYVLYRADMNPKEIYGEGWMKQVIPINRVINGLESSVYDYNHKIAKGRLVVDRDSGVRAIHTTHGEIVSKNKGADVRSLDMSPLPIAVANQIERMVRYQEDIGGIHEASLGRMPTGVRSGIGVAELKQADSMSLDEYTDNLEDFLVEAGKKLLRKVAKNYTKYHVIHALGVREGEEKYFAVVGDKAGKKGSTDEKHKNQIKMGPDWLDLDVIGEDNEIRVTIGSWLGYTKEAMQEKVLKFLEAGMIDQKTALRLMEFGSADEIVQQTRIESLLKSQLQKPAQPGQPPGEADQYGLALTENTMMINEGKPVKPDAHDDHIVHIAVHQEVLGRGMDEIVGQHMDIHYMYANMPQPSGMSMQDQANQPPAGGPPPGGGPAPQPGQPPIPGGQPPQAMQQMMGQPPAGGPPPPAGPPPGAGGPPAG